MKKIILTVLILLVLFGLVRIVTSTLENHKRNQAVQGVCIALNERGNDYA